MCYVCDVCFNICISCNPPFWIVEWFLIKRSHEEHGRGELVSFGKRRENVHGHQEGNFGGQNPTQQAKWRPCLPHMQTHKLYNIHPSMHASTYPVQSYAVLLRKRLGQPGEDISPSEGKIYNTRMNKHCVGEDLHRGNYFINISAVFLNFSIFMHF